MVVFKQNIAGYKIANFEIKYDFEYVVCYINIINVLY